MPEGRRRLQWTRENENSTKMRLDGLLKFLQRYSMNFLNQSKKLYSLLACNIGVIFCPLWRVEGGGEGCFDLVARSPDNRPVKLNGNSPVLGPAETAAMIIFPSRDSHRKYSNSLMDFIIWILHCVGKQINISELCQLLP